MRWLALCLALLIAAPAAAQDVARKKKKPQAAHKKPSAEQIRRFKELEKKQKR